MALDRSPFGELMTPGEASLAESAAPLANAGEQDIDLVMRLGRALHAAGSPANRIEEGMEAASMRLGLAGQFFSTPTALFASFAGLGPRRTVLERVQPGIVNLERLCDLDELLHGLADGALEPRQAAARLAALDGGSRYGPLLTTLAFAVASGAATQFLRGGAREVVAATVLGLLTGALAVVALRQPAIGRLFEPLAALLVSFLATLAAACWPPLSVPLVTLGGLIVLVPGLTLTVAINELASRQLVSGSARLMGAVALFLAIALGVAVGAQAGVAVLGHAVAAVRPHVLAHRWQWVAILAGALAFTVLLRARPRDAGWVALAGVLAIEGVRLGGRLLGPQLGAFVGALIVGIGANLFARLRRRPAALMQVPGLIMLVPGSLGFRSLQSLLEKDVVSGIETAFTAILVAIALATGTLLASVVIPPRRLL